MATDRLGLQRFQKKGDSSKDAEVWLEASQITARRGDLNEARHLLRAALQANADYVEAWLRLAWLAGDRREREALLRRVLELDPGHAQAQAELRRLSQPPRSSTSAKADRRRVGPWALSLLVLAAGLLLVAMLLWGPVDDSLAWLVPTATPTVIPTPTLTPEQIAMQFESQLEASLAEEDWERGLELVAIMHSVNPSGERVRRWAVVTHIKYGQALVAAGRADKAQGQFEQAVALAPDNVEALVWQETTGLYLTGQEAFEAGEWDSAIASFTLAQTRLPDYGDLSNRLLEAHRLKGLAALEAGEWGVAIEALTWVHEQAPEDEAMVGHLADAYRERGIAHQEAGAFEFARADLEMTLALRPGDDEAQTRLDEVMYVLFPPKRIEIDISQQRFYAWLGDTLLYSFPTSTGLRGRDTAVGHYKILDKMPMAYSSIWRLKMPYWMGIYYVGNVENGIHALPIRPDGSVMWGGLLGQRASYGCVILSTEAARIIYNWAEIGTPVDIHY